jgi:hypothetical protein
LSVFAVFYPFFVSLPVSFRSLGATLHHVN